MADNEKCPHCGIDGGECTDWFNCQKRQIKAATERAEKAEAANRKVCCAFCDFVIEKGDGDEWKDVIADHIQKCERHPIKYALDMAEFQEKAAKIFAELHGKVNADRDRLAGELSEATQTVELSRQLRETERRELAKAQAANERLREALKRCVAELIVPDGSCKILSLGDGCNCAKCQASAALSPAPPIGIDLNLNVNPDGSLSAGEPATVKVGGKELK